MLNIHVNSECSPAAPDPNKQCEVRRPVRRIFLWTKYEQAQAYSISESDAHDLDQQEHQQKGLPELKSYLPPSERWAARK
jgi:hypothetical protein